MNHRQPDVQNFINDGISQYPDYKDSGVEWLGEIPYHWETKRIKHLLIGRKGAIKTGPFGSQLHSSEMMDSEIKVFNQRTVLDRDINGGRNYISAAKFDQLKAFETFPGDLLVTTRGTIGRCMIVPIGAPRGILHPCLLRIQIEKRIAYDHFVEYLIQESGLILTQLEYMSNATTIEVIYSDSLKEVFLLLPPLPEQRAIVAFLDRETAKIDALVAKKERLIELLQEKRSALTSQAVTKGLDANVPTKVSGVEWLGEIPAHWDTKRLKTFSRIRYGLGQPPRESSNGLPLIRATNVIRGRITEENMVYVDPEDVPTGRDAFLAEGEIIVVRSGAYTADSAIIPKAYDGAVAGYDMVVAANGALSEFVAAALLCTYVLDRQLVISSMRSAQPHLNAEELGGCRYIAPTSSRTARHCRLP